MSNCLSSCIPLIWGNRTLLVLLLIDLGLNFPKLELGLFYKSTFGDYSSKPILNVVMNRAFLEPRANNYSPNSDNLPAKGIFDTSTFYGLSLWGLSGKE